VTGSGTSHLIVRSSRACGSQSTTFRRFSPTRPPISPERRRISSRLPYCSSHLHAVFGPTFSTPGMLSMLSPISVR
jgi:hypothetical protein